MTSSSSAAGSGVTAVRALSKHGLVAFNFESLRGVLEGPFMLGTRKFMFDLLDEFVDDAGPEASQLFCLVGGGGTGKSVFAATWLRRFGERAVAWHFCLHHDPSKSDPLAIVRSLAARLLDRLAGFKLEKAEIEAAQSLVKVDDVFQALIAKPLAAMEPPAEPVAILIDALDEIPKERRLAVVELITGSLSTLPKWVRLFVTARPDRSTKRRLGAKFALTELLVDDKSNLLDVQSYPTRVAKDCIDATVTVADLEMDVTASLVPP